MKKMLSLWLCVLLFSASCTVQAAEMAESPLDGYFYSVGYAYYDGGLQKQYNPSRDSLPEMLTEEIRSLLKEATQNPTLEKPKDLGHRRIKITFCDTDKPDEANNNHVRYSYDLCDNGIRITKENAVWYGTYDTFDLVPDENTPIQYVSYQGTDYSRKIGLLLNEHIGGDTEYPDFEFITDLTFHYQGQIFLQENLPKSMGYHWGICNYYINGELCTGAFLRTDAIYLAPVTETNTVHWDGATRFFPKTSSNAGLNGYFYENPARKNTLSANAVFTLDENYSVTSVKFSVTDINYPDGITADVSADIYDANGVLKKNINRYSYDKGTLAGIDGFIPSPKTEEEKTEPKPNDTEKPEKTEEDKLVLNPDYTPDADMKEAAEAFVNIISAVSPDSVIGYYVQDERTRSYSLLRTDLEATGKADAVRNLFLSHDIRMQEFISPDSAEAFQITYTCPASNGKSQTAKISLYDDHAYVLLRYPSNKGDNTVMQAKKLCFLYRGTNLKTSFKELFCEEQVAHAAVPYIFHPKYVDISEERREYAADLSMTLSPEQMQSWIGEFAENGTVKMHISYFSSQSDYQDSMVTISGNGKTLHLMETDELRNYSNTPRYAVYATSVLGTKGIDSSLKVEPLQHGSLSLNCLTGPQYAVKRDAGKLEVSIYDTYNTSNWKQKEMDEHRVGGVIPVTDAGELIQNPDIHETPISETAEIVQFEDVPKTHWAYVPVHNFYRATFVNGIGNNLFAPDQPMTYEHFGLLLTRIFGYTSQNAQNIPAARQDVMAQLVYAMGIENQTVQNEQILSDKFSDSSDIRPENLEAMKIAAEKGLVKGSNGKLYANSSLTRAECVTLLSRAIEESFGITEQDAPETYKLNIYRSQEDYKTVTAENLAEFEIETNNVDDVYIKTLSRMEGNALLTFGKNTLEDSRAVAVCRVDADVYTLELTAISEALFERSENLSAELCGILLIYKNGKLYRTLPNAWVKYEDFAEYLTFKHGDCLISFHKTYETNGKYPAQHDLPQPPEKNYSNFMAGDIGLGLGKGRDLEIGYDSDIWGNLVLRHNNLRTDAEVNSTFTATDIYGITNTYQLTLLERTSMTESELVGTFTIRKNGLEWETTTGKLKNLNAGIGNHMYFVSDDGVWNIEFTITEIAKNNG